MSLSRKAKLLLCLLGSLLWLTPCPALAKPVYLLEVQGAIGPATYDYVARGLKHAVADGAQLVVLRMDTPGGLDHAMRDIIKAMLASPIPVAAYVAPRGARAASAGTYILYASHIAAMAPGTNLGAASPVPIAVPGLGGDAKPADEGDKKEGAGKDVMQQKVMHDAAAYIRSLAQLRGRNVEWAEQAVREAASLSAAEALERQVIDHVAEDTAQLLRQLDGKKIQVARGVVMTLDTARAATVLYTPDWRTQLLAAITAPGVALILMMIGVYGLLFEFYNPGFGAPGVIGAICLLLGMYALQQLPVNYAGLALIALGIGFMVAEAFAPSFGILGLGGIAAFIFGAVILIDTDVPGFGIPISLIVVLGVVSALVLFGTIELALRARRRPIVSGSEEMIGREGVVEQCAAGTCWARIHSELWQVASAQTLQAGQPVRVTGRHGLVLEVSPISAKGE